MKSHDFARGRNDPRLFLLRRQRPWRRVIMWTSDVDGLRAEFAAKGVHIDVEPTDQSWGAREMHVRDADRNLLVFTQVNPPPPAPS